MELHLLELLRVQLRPRGNAWLRCQPYGTCLHRRDPSHRRVGCKLQALLLLLLLLVHKELQHLLLPLALLLAHRARLGHSLRLCLRGTGGELALLLPKDRNASAGQHGFRHALTTGAATKETRWKGTVLVWGHGVATERAATAWCSQFLLLKSRLRIASPGLCGEQADERPHRRGCRSGTKARNAPDEQFPVKQYLVVAQHNQEE